MTESWATYGLDLHLDVTGTRPRAALEQALREAVQSGRLACGTWLPSSRSLARDLGIARNTVAEVYQQLTAEGWLTARQGSGTHIAQRAVADDIGRSAMRQSGSGRPRLDLRYGRPDVSSFPRTLWLAAARRALNSASYEVFDYGDPRGAARLRHTLAAYLGRTRGVRTSPERIVVCSGFTQALSLLGRVLRSRGTTRMAIESHGVPVMKKPLVAAGVDLVPMTVDEQGAVTSELAALQPAAAIVTPAHQFPIGVAMSPERRAAAVDWARAAEGLIVEDDYDGEFRYDRQPVGALQALDPARVVYAGTVSKTLAPGLRLGWMAVPSSLIDEVVAAKESADLHTGVMEQLTLAEFIESGRYDKHVRSMRLRYRRRRDRLVASLAEHVPTVRVTGIPAGLHAIVKLPDVDTGRATEDAVVAHAARSHGLALSGLSQFRFSQEADDDPPALVVGYGTPSESSFGPAVEALCATLHGLE